MALIAQFRRLQGQDRGRRRERQSVAAVAGQTAPAPAEAGKHRLHGGQLHGGRHPEGAGADQRLPQIAERDHRPRRHDGVARRAGHDLRGRSRARGRHRQARHQRQGRRRDGLHLRLHLLHRRLGARPAARRQRLLPDEVARHLLPDRPLSVTKDEIADPQNLQIRLLQQRHRLRRTSTPATWGTRSRAASSG